jgi:hypothetical protein
VNDRGGQRLRARAGGENKGRKQCDGCPAHAPV